MNDATERNGFSRPVPWSGESFPWDANRNQAAVLTAEGRLSIEEVAEKVGVDRVTLWAWKKHPEFLQRVQEISERMGALAEQFAIGHKARRLEWLDDRHRRLRQVIAARAADPDMADVPGGRTGLVLKRTRKLGAGERAQMVEEYIVDVDLLRELREIEAAAARELDQLPRGGVIISNNVNVSQTQPEPVSGVELARRICEIITGRPVENIPESTEPVEMPALPNVAVAIGNNQRNSCRDL
jgi:hypothetical protein